MSRPELRHITVESRREVICGRDQAEKLKSAGTISGEFVIISAYIVANLFVGVVVKNLAEVIQERWRPRPLETPASTEESLRELRSARQTLDRLEERLRQGVGKT